MNRFQHFFKQTSSKIEEYPLPLTKYVALFIAILSIRLCLEFFANNRLFKFEDVVHISLWFLFIVLAFILQLQYFSKVPIEKVIKLVVCCFSIALSAPIIDLLVSQGKFSKMNYISINSIQDVVKAYFTIGGASLTRGATIGIRIEIILLVIASFNYIYLRTESLFRAILGTFSIYTVLFLTGIIPFLIGQINALFNLSFTPDDQSSIYLLFTLDLLLVLLISFNVKGSKLKNSLSKRTFLELITIGLPLILGIYLARLNYSANWTINPTTIYFFPLLLVLLLLLTVFQRSIKSVKTQAQNSSYQTLFLILIIAISASFSFQALFAFSICWALNYMLYEKPCEFYAIPIVSDLLQAGLALAYVFLGFIIFGAPMVGFEKFHILLILIISFSISLGNSKIKSYFS